MDFKFEASMNVSLAQYYKQFYVTGLFLTPLKTSENLFYRKRFIKTLPKI